MQNAQILFPVNVPGAFDYAVPIGMELSVGDFVYAPIGKQMKLGVVIGLGTAEVGRELKAIAERKATRPLSPDMVKFVLWTAKYNVASPGQVLRMVIRSYKALDPSPIVNHYLPTGETLRQLTSSRRAVLREGGPFPARASEIASRAGVSAGVVKGLVKIGAMQELAMPVDAPFPVPDPEHPGMALTQGQEDAAKELAAQVKMGGFSVSLLDGVTGSGKTEVYFEAVAEALRQGGQVLVLVPEIALTQAGLERFAKRFGAEPAAWHSAIGDAPRRRVWREVAQGRAKLVVGARSALYLPFADLKLIVVDEEHDTSYKQEEGVIYNARDMSVVRAKLSGHAVVLASATPSLESLHNARSGRFAHIVLPERPGAAVLPEIGLVDLKETPAEKGDFLSAPLIDAIREGLSRGEQSMLYLNRRGYAPLIICRSCGEKLKSPDTDSWLVEHRASGRAMCHLTGFSMRMPTQCPKCKADDSLTAVGPGVERVAEEAARHFPEAKIEIFSSDTAGNPAAIKDRMDRMARGEIDILVGTQMVVKGHNFLNLTFVGVVDGDLALAGGDPRAGERTYQTLVQVAGRAGRAKKAGHALIQTHQPEHEALLALAAGDRELFIGVELAMREMLGLPPFGKLAAIIIWGPDRAKTEALAKKMVSLAPRTDGVEILGPSEPPVGRLRGQYRRRLFIQAESTVNLSRYMAVWRQKIRPPAKYKVQIDIDPQSFM
ncbi:replication restart DNA helicase PriA [Litorimonas taeanensis]|uniref:Replication restart protein PriA n=1 Tax=Litorimonas taeanensis TaxID=568099 RepID=A0A420WJ31_9PROT|nr:primosomal protein N' [Litorimonas taeanensis]RKQ71007.1 replication restart DNA helicase PriA [Litorimonas taeanensis]